MVSSSTNIELELGLIGLGITGARTGDYSIVRHILGIDMKHRVQ